MRPPLNPQTLKWVCVAGTLALGACATEQQAAIQPAIYCYQSLAAVTCLDEPYRRDDKRLVNYIGPHPSRYPSPPPSPPAALKAPAPIDYWVKDSEPVPKPAR